MDRFAAHRGGVGLVNILIDGRLKMIEAKRLAKLTRIPLCLPCDRGNIGARHANQAEGLSTEMEIRLIQMPTQDLFNSGFIRKAHSHFLIETTCPDKSRVNHVGMVGRGDDNDPGLVVQSAQLRQQPVHDRVHISVETPAFRLTAAVAVEFVDEKD